MSYVIYHMSYVVHQISDIIYHTTYIICHMSHIISVYIYMHVYTLHLARELKLLSPEERTALAVMMRATVSKKGRVRTTSICKTQMQMLFFSMAAMLLHPTQLPSLPEHQSSANDLHWHHLLTWREDPMAKFAFPRIFQNGVYLHGFVWK